MLIANSFIQSYAQGFDYKQEKELAQGGLSPSLTLQILQLGKAQMSILHALSQLPTSSLKTRIITSLPLANNLSRLWILLTAFTKAEIFQLPQPLQKLSILSHRHLGSVLLAATIIAGIALAILGTPLVGAGTLSGVLYHYMDQQGYIPHKISTLVSSYFPFISALWLLSSQPDFFSLVQLAISSPKTVNYLGSYISSSLFYDKDSCGPHTISHELIEYRHLNKSQIDLILKTQPEYFVVNPQPLSQAAYTGCALEQDHDITCLQQQFNQIKWEEKTSLLECKFQGDDRFIEHHLQPFFQKSSFTDLDLIKKNLPIYLEFWKTYCSAHPDQQQQTTAQALKNFSSLPSDQQALQLQTHLQALNLPSLTKKNLKNHIKAYAKLWQQLSETSYAKLFKEKFVYLMKTLNKEVGHERNGTTEKIDQALEHLSYVIPQLQKDITANRSVAIEDVLMRLGIEGGDYCLSGTLEVCESLKQGAINSSMPEGSPENYLLDLKYRLQLARENIVIKDAFRNVNQMKESTAKNTIHLSHLSFFKKILLKSALYFHQNFAKPLIQDVHINLSCKLSYFAGFTPLNPDQTKMIDVLDSLLAFFYKNIRDAYLLRYRKKLLPTLDETPAKTTHYICELIQENRSLNTAEKDDLLKKFAESKRYRNFQHLMLFQLGIIKFKSGCRPEHYWLEALKKDAFEQSSSADAIISATPT